MQTKANIFRGQWGGSTLIGLILGLCLGMLALIKWPQLEMPIKALLAEHDIQIETVVDFDSKLRPNLPMSASRAHDTPKSAASIQMPTKSASQPEGNALEVAYPDANSAVAALTVSESREADARVSTNDIDSAYSGSTSVGAQRVYSPSANVAETDAPDGTSDAQMTSSAATPYVEALAEDFEPDTVRYETREVWQAFSSESAAEAFATVVSNVLNIEVHTLRQSDHKIVPIVRCDGRRECDAISAEITAFLAGSSESGVYDEI